MARAARTQSVWTESFVAGADLSGKQFYVVKLDAAADGQVILADGDTVGIGILQNPPKSGQDASVMLLGMSRGVASGAIANGVEVASDGNGKLKTAAAGDVVIGLANTTAANDGEIIEVLMIGRYYKHA